MVTEQQRDLLRMLQSERHATIKNPRAKPFIHVFSSPSEGDGFHCFSFLLPIDQIDSFLSDLCWERHNGDFTPRVECCTSARGREVYYLPTGDEQSRQAFIYNRNFSNYWPSSIEVCEEFRLFHNLFFHSGRNIYLHCDVNGKEHEVVRMEKEVVTVSLRFLSEFLRAKQMALALQYDSHCTSKFSLEELGLGETCKQGRNEHSVWQINIRPYTFLKNEKSIALLAGKAVIPCLGPIDWKDPYEEEPEDFQDFIVGHDTSGQPKYDTCDYERIRGDYSRAMSPVYFKRSVLTKYYNEPHRYEINSTGLCCGSSWHLSIDNDGRKYVIAFLKDLSSLPKEEREYWKTYNVLPDGPISEASYLQNFRGWFASPAMPDTQFKFLYRRINEQWHQVYGWPLWLEAPEGDAYLLRQAHICLEDSQKEFDEQNGIMAKLLCEYLNNTCLKKALAKPSDGSVNQFRDFMLAEGFEEAASRLGPFYAFQALRSTGTAHRKGEKYDEALKKGGLTGKPLEEASYILFERMVGALRWIKECLAEKKAG